MNKSLLIFIILSVFIISCKKENSDLPKKTSGKINTISIIIEDQLWNGEIGDLVRNKFASPVIGLPEEEPLFTINQYPAKLMEGFMTDSRIIIIIKKEDKNEFVVKKNQYAAPQYVFHITGKTSDDIIEILNKNSPKIIQLIKNIEIEECQRIINQSLIDIKKIKDTFNIKLNVPTGYLYALEKSKFIWLKKEIVSGSTSVLIYQVPLGSLKKDSNLVTNIIKMRDSIGKLYIQGTEPDSPMITGEGYAPYLFKIKLDEKETFVTKGTWELKNDFMSGPFINYAIVDKENDRILILEGFCYSPSKEERDLMQELESIIKSLKVLH